jgi:hypothetical protein
VRRRVREGVIVRRTGEGDTSIRMLGVASRRIKISEGRIGIGIERR